MDFGWRNNYFYAWGGTLSNQIYQGVYPPLGIRWWSDVYIFSKNVSFLHGLRSFKIVLYLLLLCFYSKLKHRLHNLTTGYILLENISNQDIPHLKVEYKGLWNVAFKFHVHRHCYHHLWSFLIPIGLLLLIFIKCHNDNPTLSSPVLFSQTLFSNRKILPLK